MAQQEHLLAGALSALEEFQRALRHAETLMQKVDATATRVGDRVDGAMGSVQETLADMRKSIQAVNDSMERVSHSLDKIERSVESVERAMVLVEKVMPLMERMVRSIERAPILSRFLR